MIDQIKNEIDTNRNRMAPAKNVCLNNNLDSVIEFLAGIFKIIQNNS